MYSIKILTALLKYSFSKLLAFNAFADSKSSPHADANVVFIWGDVGLKICYYPCSKSIRMKLGSYNISYGA